MIRHLKEGARFRESHIGMIEDPEKLKELIIIGTVNMTTLTDMISGEGTINKTKHIHADSTGTWIGHIQREVTIAGKETITMTMSEDTMTDTMIIQARTIDILFIKIMVIPIVEIMIGTTIVTSYAVIAQLKENY